MKLTKRAMIFFNENHDNCTSCGKKFKEGHATHLGYFDNRELVHLGDCCSKKLESTIARFRYEPRKYEIPNQDVQLWRFMDFTKYVSLLSSKKIFFTRADLFDDPFEGAKGLKKNKNKWDQHYLKFFKKALKNEPNGYYNNKPEKEINLEAKKLLQDLDKGSQIGLQKTFISCWHENSYESEAMWKLYTSNFKEGIAIKTTFKKFYESIGKDPGVMIGRVNYIDYEKRFVGINQPFWYKRKSFEHEKEVRAIIFDHRSENELGKLINVDISKLIKEVYVSPNSEKWFFDLVQEITNKYKLKRKIKMSNMGIEPFH